MLLRCFRQLSVSAAAAARSRTVVMGKKSVYAVVSGRRPGLYTSWEQCLLQVKGFPQNRYKGFESEREALQYLSDNGVAAAGLLEAAGAAGSAAGAVPEPAAAAGAAAGTTAAAAAAAPPPRPPRKRKPPASTGVSGGSGGWTQAASSATAPATGRVFRLEFDGASKRNPGPGGFGAVLYDDATGVEVARMCQYMGDRVTNNQAEYAGLIAGLQAALELGCQRVRVQGDSTLIIRQVLGEWRVKNEGLQPYHAAATALVRRFASFEARQVLREFNKAADALSNQAIDDWRSGANRHVWSLEAVAAAVGDAVLEGEEEEEEAGREVEEEEGAAAGAAATAAAAAGRGEPSGGGGGGAGGDGGEAALAVAEALDSAAAAAEERAEEHAQEGSEAEGGDSSSSSSEEEEDDEAPKRARLG